MDKEVKEKMENGVCMIQSISCLNFFGLLTSKLLVDVRIFLQRRMEGEGIVSSDGEIYQILLKITFLQHE